MHRTLQKCHCEPVTDVTGVAIRSFLCTAPLVTRGNGFPRRCAPRNDILTKIILPCVGAGFYPARSAAPSRLSPVGRRPCVPPPTIAAPPTAGHTGPALQAFYQLRTPCPAPVGRGALTPLPICTAFPKNLSLRTGAHAGVAIRPSFFRPFIQKIKPKIMQNIKIQKPLANKGTQC